MRALTIFSVAAILFAGVPAGRLHASAAKGPHLQYVGAVAINPCQDPRVLAEWYSRLGIETHESGGGLYGTFMTPAGPFFFAIHPKRKDAAKTSSSSVSIVFRVDDYDGYISAVRERGLEPNGVERDSEGKFAHFKDPDGNEVTLWGK